MARRPAGRLQARKLPPPVPFFFLSSPVSASHFSFPATRYVPPLFTGARMTRSRAGEKAPSNYYKKKSHESAPKATTRIPFPQGQPENGDTFFPLESSKKRERLRERETSRPSRFPAVVFPRRERGKSNADISHAWPGKQRIKRAAQLSRYYWQSDSPGALGSGKRR